jgi:hypothetical protein
VHSHRRPDKCVCNVRIAMTIATTTAPWQRRRGHAALCAKRNTRLAGFALAVHRYGVRPVCDVPSVAAVGPTESSDATRQACAMNPLLAHPRHVIEPFQDDGKRDDGEKLLRLLRPVLRLVSTGVDKAGLLDNTGSASLGAALGAAPDAVEAVHAAFLNPQAPWKPTVRLVAPVATFFDGDLLDANLSEKDRITCVPVRGEAQVAVPVDANPPPPRLIAQVPRRRLVGAGGSGGDSDRGKGTLTLTRVAHGELEVAIRSDAGRRQPAMRVTVVPVTLERLFARAPPSPLALALLPTTTHEVSGRFADAVAQFWQMRLRAHVLPAALAPSGAVRPLGIEVVTLRTNCGAKQRTTLRAELAPSCAACICGLHGAQSDPASDSTAAQPRCVATTVCLELSMCGQPTYEQQPGCACSPLWCRTHNEATPQVRELPFAACGFGLQAAVACVHKMADGARRTPVWHPFGLCGSNVLHARALIAAATKTQAAAAPLVGQAQRAAQLCEVCDAGADELEAAMDAVYRERSVETPPAPDEEELQRHDVLATDLLRAHQGAVFQHTKPDGSPTLARLVEGRTVPLKAAQAACAPTHAHWFPSKHRAKRRGV